MARSKKIATSEEARLFEKAGLLDSRAPQWFWNGPYQTPHLDDLAAEGTRLADFHSRGPVCPPTRAGLLTGRYQQRAGIPEVINADPAKNRHHGLDPSEVTFSELLRQAGYATAVFGKRQRAWRAVWLRAVPIRG